MLLGHLGKAIVIVLLNNAVVYGAAAQEALKEPIPKVCKCTCKGCKQNRMFLLSFPSFQAHKFDEASQVHIQNAQLKERNKELAQENTRLHEVINFIATDDGSLKKLGSFILGISVGVVGVAFYYRQKLAKFAKVAVR